MRHVREFFCDFWRVILLVTLLLWLVSCATGPSLVSPTWFELPSTRLDPDYVSEQIRVRCKDTIAICQSQSILGNQQCMCYRP